MNSKLLSARAAAGCALALVAAAAVAPVAQETSDVAKRAMTAHGAATNSPRIVDTRTIDVAQMVVLRDVPRGAKRVRMWIPIPSDGPWQRVLDRRVISATPGWKIVRQPEANADFIVIDTDKIGTEPIGATVQCIVERQGVVSTLGTPSAPVEADLFSQELNQHAPLMEATDRVRKLANDACGTLRDPTDQVRALMNAVMREADHYSKDASKPRCGRGSAEDCMDHGGGCCTDMHSLLVALCRAKGIPARIQYGYRVLDVKAGEAYDPGYRCWVEVNLAGGGWIPTDIVAGDARPVDDPTRIGSLSATRVWLWQGRSFPLTPAASTGTPDTMICGWAEIDGTPVNPLPEADGTPSKLSRTIQFKVMERVRAADAPMLPE